MRRASVVVLVVEGELVVVDRAVVRERGPHANGDVATADDLVHPQHVRLGIEGVQAALRVLAHLPGPVGLVDPVVVEVRLE